MSIERPSNGWNIRRKPIHPGEMLREEFLIPLKLSANKLALNLRVPATRISEIVNERRSITADTALRLERCFGMSADFWLALQKDYDLQMARHSEGRKILTDVVVLRKQKRATTERSPSPVQNLREKPTRQKFAAGRTKRELA